jgi:pimeloyl-ACP methyl ester carboxylesterase
MADTNQAVAGAAGPEPGQAEDPFPPLAGVEHRFIDLPGLRMHVAEAGHGEPVLLLHGFPQHWWEWRKVIPGLTEHHRVICPDLRGAGWTDAAPGGYTRDQLRADIVALLDALALDRVQMIGHDWGALVGFQLCLNHPGRVRNYLCLGPHPFLRFDPRLLTVMWRLWFQAVIVTPVLGPRLLSKGDQRFARYMLVNDTADRGAWSDEDIELFISRLRDPARARAASSLYRGFIMREARRIMGGAYRSTRLTTPTRLLIGAKDPVVRPRFLRGYQDHADDLTLEVVDGASHFIADERPDAVVEHALEFFGPPDRGTLPR